MTLPTKVVFEVVCCDKGVQFQRRNMSPNLLNGGGEGSQQWKIPSNNDEIWMHHNTVETKQQSKHSFSQGEYVLKQAKVDLSVHKMMAAVFGNARVIIHINYLPMERTINGEHYANLLDRFNEDLKKKKPMIRKNAFFHQDYARMLTCVVAMAKFNELGNNLLPHPPYSPTDHFPLSFRNK